MKKILVLGAGPISEVPKSDIVFTANAAIGWHKDAISSIPRKVAVVSSHELLPKLRAGSDFRQKQYFKKFEAIINAPCDLLIAIHSDRSPEGVISLATSNYKNPIKELSFKDCRELLLKLSGVPEPIYSFHKLNKKVGLTKFSSLLLSYALAWLKIRFLKNKNVRALFRPSTGIIALLCAISEGGEDAEYTTCGINFGKRDSYANGESAIFKNTTHWELDPHIVADILALESLKKRYKIKIN